MLDYFPILFQFTRWRPADLMNLGLAMTVLSSIGFGLVSSQWIGEYSYYLLGREPDVVVEPTVDRRRLAGIWFSVGTVLLTIATCAVAYVSITIFVNNGETLWLQLTWIISVFLFLFGSLMLDGVLYGWNPERIPTLVDESTAQIGLQALEIARGNTSGLFFPGVTGSPMLTYLPAAIAIRITGDPLLGIRLGAYQIPIEDDGRWIANVATALLAFGYAILHFSRGPIYLAPVAWGTLGLWALLRGLRTGDWFALALSGALIGWGSVMYAGGLLYLIITPIWWIGVWLLRREWLYNRGFGVGAPGFLLWLGGMVIMIAPILAVWLVDNETFTAFTQKDIILNSLTSARLEILYDAGGFDSVFWENLKLTLLTFNIYPNAGAHFGLVGPFLNSIGRDHFRGRKPKCAILGTITAAAANGCIGNGLCTRSGALDAS